MLSLLRKMCPYPTIDATGSLLDGLAVGQPSRCSKCRSKSCRTWFDHAPADGPIHGVCEFGYSLVSTPTPFGRLCINGIFVPFQNAAMDAAAKKQNRSQKVPWEEINAFSQSLSGATAAVNEEMQRCAQDAVAGLHDIKTAVNVVFRNTEAIVSSLPGVDDYERIEGAPGPLKALLKSVNLLNSRLNLASVVANPESARYGQRRRTPVYRVFHRMVRLFEQEGAKKHISVRMTGSSQNRLWLYDSFETLPLVLIDNAIKYSTGGRDVVVRVDDAGSGGCRASVESWGPIVPKGDRQRIFERGFRAADAIQVAASGSGLGLFIARTVAEANGCTLSYSESTRYAGDQEGTNVFSLELYDAPE